MKISDGIETLELRSLNLTGSWSVINPVLIRDNDTFLLVDAGYPGQLPQIRDAVEQAGVPFSDVNKVIITHHDLDHIGSLADIRRETVGCIEVLAHAGEVPYIQGELPPVKQTPERLAQREAQFNALPEELKPRLKAFLSPPVPVAVDRTLADGEELPHAGGIVAIHTPGHSPGHLCLYHKRSRSLISGDALNVSDGLLAGPNPVYTPDLATALASLKKLAAYDIETVICYHGGVYRGNANRRIAELADGR
ncbi:MAG: MBL fold metallo-hydrolase [Oryzomonas sp.]|uniref:MBL fold metallo-hydrolase n=1 Tax=Oryzomonas sp. TaxID=2855186 RepID=UPI00283EA077|nr:MBL fold metallo-hydrolase [Oryzomonas sp.]MDR3579820.1 MBL fold metallo-hydrolase [Oryzomonas sp.]